MFRTTILILTTLFIFTGFSNTSVFSAPAERFIEQLANKAFTSLGQKGISDKERSERFTSFLEEAFDLKRIGRFTLGRYVRIATTKEKEEFLTLFKKFVVQAYVNRFKDLSGKTFRVLDARELSATNSLVLSELRVKGKPTIKVNWRVITTDATHKIVDVMIEGISMSVTLRDEFVAVIRKNRGKVGGLIEALRKKTSSK